MPTERHTWQPDYVAPPEPPPAPVKGRAKAAEPQPMWPRFEATPASCLRIVNARGNNLKGVTVDIPVGVLTCVPAV